VVTEITVQTIDFFCCQQ